MTVLFEVVSLSNLLCDSFTVNSMIINKHNMRYWAPKHTHLIHQYPHSVSYSMVCCWLFWHYWTICFKGNGVTVTVNSAHYFYMLQTFFRPGLRRQRITLQNVLFLQDGTTAHTANTLMDVLRCMFRERISCSGDVQ